MVGGWGWGWDWMVLASLAHQRPLVVLWALGPAFPCPGVSSPVP